jgi:hypothetical protein
MVLMKQQFREDKTGTLKLSIYSNNRPLVPTSATITLYKPSGEVLEASGAVSGIDSTTGEMTYSLTATHTDVANLNYKAEWAYVSGGVTYYENQLFDVVKSILSIPIVDDDLYNELESLRKVNHQSSGTASSGTASTLVDTKRKEDDNYWKGGLIEIIAGTGVGQIRTTTSFTQSTGSFAITPDFVTTPDTTSVYRVVKSFTNKIKQCFEKLEEMLYGMGKRNELILESSQIKIPLLYLTIHFICLDLMDESDDKWDRLSKVYWDKFKEAFTGMRLEYDSSETGFIEGGEEEQQSPTEVRLFRC